LIKLVDIGSKWIKLVQNGHGLDKHGLDKHGLDKHGLDKHCLDKHGLDKHGLDKHGLDKHGLDKHGLDMVFTNIARSLGLTFNLVWMSNLWVVSASLQRIIRQLSSSGH
jgi:hypothetical protein